MTVHTEPCMGTSFTIDVRDPGDWGDAIADAVAWLHRVDELFSTYREDSRISRIRRGELRVDQADPDVREVLGLCAQVEAETGGWFSARWDGRLDPTGLVKGWAIERASDLLRARGSRNHGVNGGGDMQLAGEHARAEPWRVGISDPRDPARLLTIVEGRDFALATSGTAERGRHIVDPHADAASDTLAAVTVLGRSLTRVDAYATAAFAMGDRALAWLEARPGTEGLVVAADGTIAATTGFYAR
jgi:thiamine biosynthesis lipoprotein